MVKPGDKLKVVHPFITRGLRKHFGFSKFYEKDMILEILEPTGQDPCSVMLSACGIT